MGTGRPTPHYEHAIGTYPLGARSEERQEGNPPSETPHPPPTHDFQVLPAAQSGSETPGAGAPGRAESVVTSQALEGARQRRAVSEGSLPPTGWAPRAPIRAGGAAREGESTSAWDRAGGGWGVSDGGNLGVENIDIDGGQQGGGGWVAWGRLMWQLLRA